MVSLFLFFHILLWKQGVSRLLFLLPQAPMIMQVIFICSIEDVFFTAEAIIEKSVFSSVPVCSLDDAENANLHFFIVHPI